MDNLRKSYLSNVKKVVVKVGSSTLTHESGLLNLNQIDILVRQLANLQNMDLEVTLVTSGAIAAGMGKLHLKKRPQTIPEKQAAAAVGQGILLHMYEKLFSEYGQTVAQILLTKEDLLDENRFSNCSNAMLSLLSQKVIPIINENDAVAVDEIKFGDNDTLSAEVAGLIGADLLIILSDINGFYDSNPKINKSARLIDFVEEITSEVETAAGDAGSKLGTGGMYTKIQAGKIASGYGTDMIIVNGSIPNILEQVIEGKNVGTFFKAKEK